MNWLWQGILRFGSPLLVLTVVACGGSGSRLLVPTPPTTELPTLPDQVSQANLDALVDALPDSFLLGEAIEIPAQSFSFPAGLLSLTITITDPDGEEVVIVLTPELLGCNPTGTVCMIPATSLVLPELKPGTYSLSFEAIDQSGIPYGADKEIAAQEQEMEDTPSPAPFNPNPGPRPDPAGTPTPSPSPEASPTPEPTPTADPGAEPIAGFDSQPARRSTINVGSALIGQSTSTSLTIIEIGNAPLQVEASITGQEASDFQIEPKTFLIPDGGANQVATITCTPTAVGNRAATLTLTTNDPARPTINYPLECKGLAAPVAGFGSAPVSGSAIDLGSAILGQPTTAQTLTISETGNLKLEVGAGSITGANKADFEISPDTAFSIEEGGSPQDVTITCTPSTLGSLTAKLEFITNDPNNATVSYDLECEGLAVPEAGFVSDPVAGSAIDLGSAILGQPTTAQTLTISETGNLKLEVGAGTITGTNAADFEISPDTAFSIEDGESPQDVTITCTPSALGSLSATLEFTTNDPNNATVSYPLSCEGVIPAPSLVVNTLVDENGTEPDMALKCSLREAIIANNNGADFGGCADPNGTITFDSALTGTITLAAAPPAIEQDVVVSGPGASTLTVSGNHAQRVFDIAATNNPVVTIEKLTLTQGKATNADGGAILADGTGMLTIDSVTITNSTATGAGAGRGGGIRARTAMVSNSSLSDNSAANSGGGIHASAATVTNSTFSNNTAVSLGGGIFAVFTATVTDSTISNNFSTGSSGGGIRAQTVSVTNSTLNGNSALGNGGGINGDTVTVTNGTIDSNSAGDGYGGGGIYSNSGMVDVTNSTISNNSASYGGGIRNVTASVTLTNSILSNNTATGNGGGIGGADATITNSTISGNSSGNFGGGIRAGTLVVSGSTFSLNEVGNDGGGFDATSATVTNSTFSGNSAGRDGGGISAYQGLTVNNSTIVSNSGNGGGVFRFASVGTFEVNNTIIAGNTNSAGNASSDILGTSFTGNHNLIGAGGSGGLTDGVDDNIVDLALTFATLGDVLETTLTINDTIIFAGDPNALGGQQPVLTHALVSPGPAIDAGDDAFNPSGLLNDQRGLPRLAGSNVDIGAFEVQLP